MGNIKEIMAVLLCGVAIRALAGEKRVRPPTGEPRQLYRMREALPCARHKNSTVSKQSKAISFAQPQAKEKARLDDGGGMRTYEIPEAWKNSMISLDVAAQLSWPMVYIVVPPPP